MSEAGGSGFMQRAIQLACESVESGGGPFGAVVVRDGAVVAEGMNRVVPGCDPTAHAEVQAIRAACLRLGTHELRGCTVYTSCEPCPMCLGALLWARVERIVFAASRDEAAAAGFSDAALYEEVALPISDRPTPMQREAAEAGEAPFAAWMRLAGRRTY